MSTFTEIELLAESIDVTQTIRTVCPECRGGNSYEKSLTILHTGSYVQFRCWRASCGISGIIDRSGRLPTPKVPTKKDTSYKGHMTVLDEKDCDMFYNLFGFNQETILKSGILSDGEGGYLFPISVLRGPLRGWNHRYTGWKEYKKNSLVLPFVNKLHRENNSDDLPLFSLVSPNFNASRSKICVIVEDHISMHKVASLGYSSACLYGVNLSESVVEELRQHDFSTYVLAFDPDALQKAISLCRKWNGVLPMRVVNLPDDPKSCNVDLLKGLIGQ